MCRQFEPMTIRQPLALDQQLLRCDLLLDDDRGTFRYQAKSRQSRVSIAPTGNEILHIRYLFGNVARVTRIPRKATLYLFPDNLTKPQLDCRPGDALKNR